MLKKEVNATMKPMLLTAVEEVPISNEWIYEVKYDGYRCLLRWTEEEFTLLSRNGKDITNYFPEIVKSCQNIYNEIKEYLPIILDGEIVYLENDFKSNFSIVQTRGKMRTKNLIEKASNDLPCTYIVFDLLLLAGKDLTKNTLMKRKEQLDKLFQPIHETRIKKIIPFQNENDCRRVVQIHNGEGIIAKKKNSYWEAGKRSVQWLKIKNWRIVSVIVTKFEKENGYFNGAVYKDNELIEIVTFRHGLSDEQLKTLSQFFQSNGKEVSPSIWELPPSVCVDIACIDFDGKKLREPRFDAFRFDLSPEDVHWKSLQRQLNPIPETIQITHPEKLVWPKLDLVKDDYLYYLQKATSFILPFLKDRALTAIRYPHGANGERFYQKNAPHYAPDFVQTFQIDDIEYIVCNDVETLLWLGNQLALEFHIPFQTIDTHYPTEIVFDLDPPSQEEFSLAIEAAVRMKAIFDHFQLESFIKTTGGKGLQLYIPLPKNKFIYEETRVFTKFVCDFLCEQEPKWFTTERLKKNRNNKLYLDYVQHAEGKTIVAPYSTRGSELGLVATPLYWEEVTSHLKPTMFTIPALLERFSKNIDPFKNFYFANSNETFGNVLTTLKELKK